MSTLDLLIDALAATRLTRLVVEDTFPPVKNLRERFTQAHSTEEEIRTQGADPQVFAREFGFSVGAAEDLAETHPGRLLGLTTAIRDGQMVVTDNAVVPREGLESPSPDSPAIRAQVAAAQRVLDAGAPAGHYWKPDSWAELITCPWCAGFWICGAVVAARGLAPRQWSPIAKALAFSMVVGLIESKIDVD